MAPTGRTIQRTGQARLVAGALTCLPVVGVLLFVLIFVALGSSSIGKKSSAEVNLSLAQIEDDLEPVIIQEDEFFLLHVNGEFIQNVQTVYVIPGGGNSGGAYPEWTKRRVEAAFQHYTQLPQNEKNAALFLALSAGSLNSANALATDRRIVFESQHTLRHLVQLGVPKSIIFGDTFSWDTVTNGMTLRTFVEGVQEYRRVNEKNFVPAKQLEDPVVMKSEQQEKRNSNDNNSNNKQKKQLLRGNNRPAKSPPVLRPLVLEVFISDFHADRVRAAFDWVLRLAPALSPASVELRINAVSSMGIDFGSQLDYAHRVAHEAEGVKRIAENAKSIRTMAQFHAFLMLGGHQGLHKYLHYDYEKSQGAAW